MNDQEDVYDEYEILRDTFGPEALEVENNISEDPNKQATKFLDNAVSYTHLTLPTIYSV